MDMIDLALIQKIIDGIASPEELQLFRERLLDMDQAQYEAYVDEYVRRSSLTGLADPERWRDAPSLEVLLQKINTEHDGLETPRRPIHRVYSRRTWLQVAAAVLLLVAGACLWTVLQQRSAPAERPVAAAAIQPGKTGAVLTLANGTQVQLDSVQNGVIALQGGAVAKVVHGTLVYEGHGGQVVYNTMRTPKGRQFQVTLPDGTQVWLNAASSIHYPTAFNGQERVVDITGEAYFEVAANVTKPFKVNVNNKAQVTVLGTRFNVNAYDNEESINTTLLDGAVKVSKGARSGLLRPGEQARITDQISIERAVNLDKVMAWKNGLFNFEGLSFEEIMRQLERWYDIAVVYEGSAPTLDLTGKITRDVSLDGLLGNLAALGMHYRLEGRQLIILSGK